jgi:hypothetical protein
MNALLLKTAKTNNDMRIKNFPVDVMTVRTGLKWASKAEPSEILRLGTRMGAQYRAEPCE